MIYSIVSEPEAGAKGEIGKDAQTRCEPGNLCYDDTSLSTGAIRKVESNLQLRRLLPDRKLQ
jgi:hypothetical protein